METRKPIINPAPSLGDRAVAIAGLIALIATGFFGAAPETMINPISDQATTQSAE